VRYHRTAFPKRLGHSASAIVSILFRIPFPSGKIRPRTTHASMKKAFLLILLTPALAFCDVYRFYVVQYDTAAQEEFSKLSGPELLALSSSGKATLYAFAELETKEGNVGSFSNLHEIEYTETFESDGSAKSKAKKSVGTEFMIEESKGGVAAYTFKDTRLVRWQPLSPKADVLHPVMKTVSASNKVSIRFNSILATGSFTTDGLTSIYLLERKAGR
jgi:hypothetical protein